MDFERFTNKARQVMAHSQQILQRYKHNQLDTEHILLALLEQPEGVVPRILEAINADMQAITAQVERSLGRRPQTVSCRARWKKPRSLETNSSPASTCC